MSPGSRVSYSLCHPVLTPELLWVLWGPHERWAVPHPGHPYGQRLGTCRSCFCRGLLPLPRLPHPDGDGHTPTHAHGTDTHSYAHTGTPHTPHMRARTHTQEQLSAWGADWPAPGGIRGPAGHAVTGHVLQSVDADPLQSVDSLGWSLFHLSHEAGLPDEAQDPPSVRFEN